MHPAVEQGLVATDIIGIHDYDDDPERIARRYCSLEVPKLLARERPGAKALVLDSAPGEHPIVLGRGGCFARRLIPLRQ